MTPNCSTWARCPTTSGLVEGHRSEHDRFEVDRANAARDVLREHGNRCGPCRTRSRSTAPKRERSRVAIRRSRTVFDAPVLDRSFGSMADQRTTNAPGGASCQRRALADCWPERSDGAPKKTPYVVQKMRHF